MTSTLLQPPRDMRLVSASAPRRPAVARRFARPLGGESRRLVRPGLAARRPAANQLRRSRVRRGARSVRCRRRWRAAGTSQSCEKYRRSGVQRGAFKLSLSATQVRQVLLDAVGQVGLETPRGSTTCRTRRSTRPDDPTRLGGARDRGNVTRRAGETLSRLVARITRRGIHGTDALGAIGSAASHVHPHADPDVATSTTGAVNARSTSRSCGFLTGLPASPLNREAWWSEGECIVHGVTCTDRLSHHAYPSGRIAGALDVKPRRRRG